MPQRPVAGDLLERVRDRVTEVEDRADAGAVLLVDGDDLGFQLDAARDRMHGTGGIFEHRLLAGAQRTVEHRVEG